MESKPKKLPYVVSTWGREYAFATFEEALSKYIEALEVLARASVPGESAAPPEIVLALIERVRQAEARATAFDEIRAELGMVYEDGTPYPIGDVVDGVRALNEMESAPRT